MLLSACLLKPTEMYCGFSRLQSQFRAHAMKCLTIFFFKKKKKQPLCQYSFHPAVYISINTTRLTNHFKLLTCGGNLKWAER